MPQLDVLVNGLGGISAATAALKDFRDAAKAAGFPCVHIQVSEIYIILACSFTYSYARYTSHFYLFMHPLDYQRR